ncbi:hypothetical protein C8R44DRAFT_395131 [Mycena epipterygia]|nr:hypothetical protein C8R44DRAFT_395131 [Mycena epipterygia]
MRREEGAKRGGNGRAKASVCLRSALRTRGLCAYPCPCERTRGLDETKALAVSSLAGRGSEEWTRALMIPGYGGVPFRTSTFPPSRSMPGSLSPLPPKPNPIQVKIESSTPAIFPMRQRTGVQRHSGRLDKTPARGVDAVAGGREEAILIMAAYFPRLESRRPSAFHTSLLPPTPTRLSGARAWMPIICARHQREEWTVSTSSSSPAGRGGGVRRGQGARLALGGGGMGRYEGGEGTERQRRLSPPARRSMGKRARDVY